MADKKKKLTARPGSFNEKAQDAVRSAGKSVWGAMKRAVSGPSIKESVAASAKRSQQKRR